MTETKFPGAISLGLAAGLAIGAFSAYGLAVDSRNDYLYNQAYRKAETIVDTNKDGKAAIEEWSCAYEKARIEPAWFRSRPTMEELEKIIKSANK